MSLTVLSEEFGVIFLQIFGGAGGFGFFFTGGEGISH